MNTEDTIKQYQDVLRQYNILNQISKTVASTLDLNKILKIILTGVTFGDGFGFNRAFLFLIDRHSKNLTGKMAIGPASADDAWKVWSDIQEKNYALEEFLNSDKFEKEPHFSILDEKIRSISFPVDRTRQIWKCLEDGIPRNVDLTIQSDINENHENENPENENHENENPGNENPGNENHPDGENQENGKLSFPAGSVDFHNASIQALQVITVNDVHLIDIELAEYIDHPKFCVIPLISRTKKVGILIVDNKYNQRDITSDDVKFLLMLSQFAASSIRNTRIYNDLKDSIGALAKLNMQLSYLKEYNEKIIESIPISILVVDHNFTVTLCNENCGKLIGLQKEFIMGKQVNTHEIFIDNLDLIEEIARVISEKKAEGFYKVGMTIDKRKTDEIFDIILVPFKFSEETPEGAVIIIENVTNTVRLEVELNNAKKLSQLGKLSATVAHEIRNPLIAIGGYASRLKRKYTESGQADLESMDIIIDEVQRLERIVNEILDYASHKEIKFSQVNISKLLLECINLAKIAAQQNSIDIIFDCGQELIEQENLHVYGSCDHLKQAFINIINNAMDASSKKDQVKICIMKQEDEQYQNSIILNINNRAPLGNKEDIKNIFLPFYTTKTKGTGLGLTITKKIIERHSGKIEVESSIENGTTFAIKLPLIKI